MKTFLNNLRQTFDSVGYQFSIVSVSHLPELQDSLENQLMEGLLNKDFYDEITSGYKLDWNFELPTKFPNVQSIVVVAAPQPKVAVNFYLNGKQLQTIIPPTYVHDTDNTSFEILETHLNVSGYQVHKALLPEKLLAVRSGLAVYGRNNITYIEGLGSYHSVRTYFSDLPHHEETWQDVTMMDQCTKCHACSKKCPTGAIREDRFLISAERCLTYFNEMPDDFPGWIDPKWHNCLIGCMNCQDSCPVNKDFSDWVIEGTTFSEDETQTILSSIPLKELSTEMVTKLKKIYMLDDYSLLQRNLKVLIDTRH